MRGNLAEQISDMPLLGKPVVVHVSAPSEAN
jgi:hypothetical protein